MTTETTDDETTTGETTDGETTGGETTGDETNTETRPEARGLRTRRYNEPDDSEALSPAVCEALPRDRDPDRPGARAVRAARTRLRQGGTSLQPTSEASTRHDSRRPRRRSRSSCRRTLETRESSGSRARGGTARRGREVAPESDPRRRPGRTSRRLLARRCLGGDGLRTRLIRSSLKLEPRLMHRRAGISMPRSAAHTRARASGQGSTRPSKKDRGTAAASGSSSSRSTKTAGSSCPRSSIERAKNAPPREEREERPRV